MDTERKLKHPKVPDKYEVDFDRVESLSDLLEIFKGIGIPFFLTKDEYQKHKLKKFLRKIEDESATE